MGQNRRSRVYFSGEIFFGEIFFGEIFFFSGKIFSVEIFFGIEVGCKRKLVLT